MKHRFQESVKTFKCDWCEEVFNCEDELENHKTTGCAKEFAKEFACKAFNVDYLDLNRR